MSVTDEKLKNLIWLRWIAFVAILLVLSGARWIAGVFPINPISFWMTAAYGFSNLLLVVVSKKITHRFMDLILLVVLLLDTAFLTALLELNGGSNNPFSILFLAIASVGALLLSSRSMMLLILTSLIGLWIVYSEVPRSTEHMHHMASYPFHLKGMWLANSLGVLLVCGWIHYLRRMNERMATRHEKTQKILADIERVESMGRVVAQAAHQMNTPLGTLQLGLSEIGDKQNPVPPVEHDRWITDMQHAVDQITNIISRIRPELKPTDESDTESVDFDGLIKEWVSHWAKPRKIDITVECHHQPFQVSAMFVTEDVGGVLTSLLDNAFDAINGGQARIGIQISETNEFLEVSVDDSGMGMDDETRKHALDPLFTTKSKGTGLGLYVCHQVARKYDGEVRIESELGKGTRVSITFRKDKL